MIEKERSRRAEWKRRRWKRVKRGIESYTKRKEKRRKNMKERINRDKGKW